MITQRFEKGFHLRLSAPSDSNLNLLLLHGLGESGLCFQGLMESPELAGWNCLVPDLPGYGKSSWPSRPLSLSEQADVLAAWIGERGSDPLVIAGHSMGGVLGLIFCEKYPDLVQGFVNVEGNISIGDCVYSSQAARWTLEQWLARGFNELQESVYREGLEDPPMRGYYVGMRLCDPRLFHLNGLELVDLSRSEELAGRMAELEVPALYIGGTPGGFGQRSQELLTRAGVDWFAIENSGHWVFLDQPGPFLRVLTDFLERFPRQGADTPAAQRA